MIVEDEFFLGLANEQALVAAGYDVVGPVVTGDDAVETATREKPALVLMDVRLAGGSDGVDAAIRISQCQGIRSVFVTANSDRATMSRAERAKPLGWLSKPFSRPALLRAVANALRTLEDEARPR